MYLVLLRAIVPPPAFCQLGSMWMGGGETCLSLENSSRAPGGWGIVFGRIWAGKYGGTSSTLAVEQETGALPSQIIFRFYAHSDDLSADLGGGSWQSLLQVITGLQQSIGHSS
jgi:hypothetical protein